MIDVTPESLVAYPIDAVEKWHRQGLLSPATWDLYRTRWLEGRTMAWSWSHTNEGIANARAQLARVDRKRLEITFAEWKASPQGHFHPNGGKEDFDLRRYHRALVSARYAPTEVLVDWIWERTERLATSDNGGWNAWVCPYGCHTVTFDPPEDEEEDDVGEEERAC